MEGCQKSWK